MDKSNQQSSTPLSDALRSLISGQTPQSVVPQSSQSQSDPASQLFGQLITQAQKNRGMMNFNLPVETNLHPFVMKNQHPVESQATKQAIKNGADPALLNQAQSMLGKQAYLGLCEAFVERMTQGREGIYPSAISAWNQQQSRAQTDLSKAKPGDSIYFAADKSNGGFGHTGVMADNNSFISATYNGIKKVNLNDWVKQTGQKPLGFIPNDQRITQHRDQIYPKSQPLAQNNTINKTI